MRTGVVILVVLIAAAAAYYYVGMGDAPGARVTYQTAEIARGNVAIEVTATGGVEAVDTVEVSSQLSGQVAELLADFNDDVHKDQPLASLDAKTFEAAVEEAKAHLALAQAEHEAVVANVAGADARYRDARTDYEAKKTLRERGAISEREIERTRMTMLSTESELHAAQAQEKVKAASIEMAEAALRRAQIDLDRTVIRSPIDGTVIKRSVELGQTVAASLQAPTLFTIAHNLAAMEVHARVDEADIGQIRVGQPATFGVDAFPDRVFDGSVVEIRKAPEVVQNVVTYTVVIAVDNPDLMLLPGMTALIRIAIDARRGVPVIPNSALRYAPPGASDGVSGPHAWMLDHGSPVPVSIETGLSDGAATEIVGGPLAIGDRVIVGEIATPGQRTLFGLRLGF
jgi:HlyD family secretion protein